MRYFLAALLTALILSACSTTAPTPVVPEVQSSTQPEAALVSASPRPLPTTRGEFFAGSGTCTSCHRDMVDEANQDVSTDRLWRATMMANSARDPYWQAAVRAETIANPALREIIEDKCATCHNPMARFTNIHGQEASGSKLILDEGYTSETHPLHELGIDGVSCTLCHQIENLHLGEVESFSGEYSINPDLPTGNRINFGPYEIEPSEADRMRAASGFTPVYGEHFGSSEVCATCHTLFTPFVNAEGEILGEFPEQAAYLEWQHSSYRSSHSCQTCHMPPAEGGVRLSITGGAPRSPFSQHVFVGANTYVPRLMQNFGDELKVTASGEQFETTIQNAAAQLENRAAFVNLVNANIRGSQLAAEVEVRSLVGHKFPSGFPSRRAWVHFTVLDAVGNVVFESGGYDQSGAIRGNDNDLDPARFEPHYQTIRETDQVQIYEAIMHNSDGEVTTTLLRAASYVKDNRLLPFGFDKMTAGPDFAVYGEAAQDESFIGGSDRLLYDINLGNAAGPFSIEVELLYQTISFRWADNLRAYPAFETDRFLRYYESVPNLPRTAARAEMKDLR